MRFSCECIVRKYRCRTSYVYITIKQVKKQTRGHQLNSERRKKNVMGKFYTDLWVKLPEWFIAWWWFLSDRYTNCYRSFNVFWCLLKQSFQYFFLLRTESLQYRFRCKHTNWTLDSPFFYRVKKFQNKIALNLAQGFKNKYFIGWTHFNRIESRRNRLHIKSNLKFMGVKSCIQYSTKVTESFRFSSIRTRDAQQSKYCHNKSRR